MPYAPEILRVHFNSLHEVHLLEMLNDATPKHISWRNELRICVCFGIVVVVVFVVVLVPVLYVINSHLEIIHSQTQQAPTSTVHFQLNHENPSPTQPKSYHILVYLAKNWLAFAASAKKVKVHSPRERAREGKRESYFNSAYNFIILWRGSLNSILNFPEDLIVIWHSLYYVHHRSTYQRILLKLPSRHHANNTNNKKTFSF